MGPMVALGIDATTKNGCDTWLDRRRSVWLPCHLCEWCPGEWPSCWDGLGGWDQREVFHCPLESLILDPRKKRDVPKWRLVRISKCFGATTNQSPVIEFSTVLFFKQEINFGSLVSGRQFWRPSVDDGSSTNPSLTVPCSVYSRPS